MNSSFTRSIDYSYSVRSILSVLSRCIPVGSGPETCGGPTCQKGYKTIDLGYAIFNSSVILEGPPSVT